MKTPSTYEAYYFLFSWMSLRLPSLSETRTVIIMRSSGQPQGAMHAAAVYKARPQETKLLFVYVIFWFHFLTNNMCGIRG